MKIASKILTVVLSTVLLTACSSNHGSSKPKPIKPNSVSEKLLFTNWVEGDGVRLELADTKSSRKYVDLRGGYTGAGQVAVHPNGSDFLFVSWNGNFWNLYLAKYNSKLQKHEIKSLTELRGTPGAAGQPDWSPDGNKIVYVEHSDRGGPLWDVVVLDLETATSKIIATKLAGNSEKIHFATWLQPKWSHDGSSVFINAFGVGDSSAGHGLLVSVNVQTGEEEIVVENPDGFVYGALPTSRGDVYFVRWSGQLPGWTIAKYENDSATAFDVYGVKSNSFAKLTLSPGEDMLAFVDFDRSALVKVIETSTGNVIFQEKTSTGVAGGNPSWSLSGEKLSFTKMSEEKFELVVFDIDSKEIVNRYELRSSVFGVASWLVW